MTGKVWENQLQRNVNNWLARYSRHKGIIRPDGTASALGTATGVVRKENQDRAVFLRIHPGPTSRHPFIAAVLCDGMGGMVEGGACADLSVSVFVASLILGGEDVLSLRLEAAAKLANEAVFSAFSGKGGSTLSALIFDNVGSVASINVGDSRVYQVTKDGRIEQVSIDDTLNGHLAAVKGHQQSRPPEFNGLVQYIGMGEGLKVRKLKMSASSKLKQIIITSDGAHSIPGGVFDAIITNAENSEEVINRLILISEWCGGKDNATAICIPFDGLFGFLPEDSSPEGLVEIWNCFEKVMFWGSAKYQKSLYQREEDVSRSVQSPEVASQKPRGNKGPAKGKTQKTKWRPTGAGKKKRKDKDKDSGPQLEIKFSDGDE